MTLDDFVDALPPDTFSALGAAVDARRKREAAVQAVEVAYPQTGEFATLAEVERAHVLEILRLKKGNRSEAAQILGIGERTLYRKLEDYGVGRKYKPRERDDRGAPQEAGDRGAADQELSSAPSEL